MPKLSQLPIAGSGQNNDLLLALRGNQDILISAQSLLALGANLGLVVTETPFNADPTGVKDSTAGFVAATAAGGPVYVPWTSAFYSVTALSAAQIMLLWGPGLVKIAGVAQPISSQASPSLAAAAASGTVLPALAPVSNVSGGSVGFGAQYNQTTRTGGSPQYGNILDDYLVQATIGAGQFDTQLTSWATAMNLTGGQIFAGWDGANTPASALGETFSSGVAIGREINVGNRWADFGFQADVGGTRYTVGLQLVPDVVTSRDTAQTIVTISNASPAVVGWAAHGLPINTCVSFYSTVSMPAGIVAGQGYYIIPAGYGANAFEFAATPYGAAINTSSAGSGIFTGIANFPSSFGEVIGASVHGHRWWTPKLVRFDTVMPNGNVFSVNGSSTAVEATTFASFTGTISGGTTLTVSGVTGNIAIGAVVQAAGTALVPNGTTIASGSGTTWQLSQACTNGGPTSMTSIWAPLSVLQLGGFFVNGIDFSTAVYTGVPIRMPGVTAIFNSTGYGNAFGGTPVTGMNGATPGSLASLWSHVAAMTSTLRGEGLFNL